MKIKGNLNHRYLSVELNKKSPQQKLQALYSCFSMITRERVLLVLQLV